MPARDLLLAAVAHQALTPVELSADVLADHPQLNGKIFFVRVLNAGERHLYGSVALDARAEGQVIADYEVVAICACEEDGTPMFHKRDANGRITINTEDVERLRAVDGRIVHAIALKAIEVSGMDTGAKDAAKKDSPSGQSDASSSGSPSSSDAPSANS